MSTAGPPSTSPYSHARAVLVVVVTAVLTMCQSILGTYPAQAATIDTGAWYVLVNRHSSKALDLYNMATGDGASGSCTPIAGAAFPGGVPWAHPYTGGGNTMWAPDLTYTGGRYYLYYAASTFGSNRSAIFLATSTTGASGSWTNQGLVIESSASDDFNAIDPNLVIDDQGRWWLRTPMTSGGGTQLLAGHGDIHGPGHQAVLSDNDGDILFYHWYAGDGSSRLGINKLGWDAEGWPYVY